MTNTREKSATTDDGFHQHALSYLFVGQAIGNFREMGLGVRNEEVFGLRAIDGVSKTPAADSLIALAMSALGVLSRETNAALAARSVGTNQHPVPNFVAGDSQPDFVDHPDWLVTDDESGLNRVFATNNMQISAADGRECDADNGFAKSRMWPGHFFHANVIHTAENGRSHFAHIQGALFTHTARMYCARSKALGWGQCLWLMLPLSCSTELYS